LQQYIFAPFRARDAQDAAAWRYPGAYAFYNQPQWQLNLAAALRPLNTMMGSEIYSVFADAQMRDLIGFFTFTRRGQMIELGLAMRPDLTGHGNGLAFVQAGMRFATERFHTTDFILFVAAFNQRAITVYERAGFHKTRRTLRFTNGRFVSHWEMRNQE